MKTYLFLSLCLFILGLTSCYEDESSTNNKLINPLVIDLGDNGQFDRQTPSYTLFTLDTLEIKPIVYKEGIIDTNLSFTWTLQGNSIVPFVVGNKMTLKTCIKLPAEGLAYKLVFDVEDKTTNIHAQQLFDIKVESPFGLGLLVADSKDEKNSDVSLIMSYHFTSGLRIDQTRNSHDVYSLVNGRKIPYYPVNGLISSTYGQNRSLTITTPQSIDRVDPFNFNYIDGNGDIFVIDPGKYNPQKVSYISNIGTELLVMAGKIYPRSMQQSNKYYGFYLLTKDMSSYSISQLFCPQWENGLAFDEKNGRLLEINGGSNLLIFASDQLAPDAPFDQNKLQNFTCKGMCLGADKTLHTILQDKSSQKVYSYITKRQDSYEGKENGKPLRILDLNNCPEIQDAVGFASTENQNVLYYATKTKIYSIYYRGNDLIVNPEYEAPANNEIQLMDTWRQGSGKIDYANPDPASDKKVLSVYNTNRMIVLATYDKEKHEGFIRTVAITTVGTGTLEKDSRYHGEYGGYGKITTIAGKIN